MYDTTNTRLAAALKTLGFNLASCNGNYDGQTVFRFDDAVLFGKTPGQYNFLWREKEWHDFNPNHPFHYIVKAAEARDWIINRVIHGEYQETGGEGDNYFVLDINIAACIIADGFYLLRFVDRRFYFVSEARETHRACIEPARDSSLWWQCNYLKQLKRLMTLVPREKNVLDKPYASV